MLYAPDMPQKEIEKADWKQWRDEAKLRKQGLCTTYSEVLSSQDYGPLQKMVIPADPNRKSKFPHLHRSLKCRAASRAIDFDRVYQAFEVRSSDGSIIEPLPLDVLAEVFEHR